MNYKIVNGWGTTLIKAEKSLEYRVEKLLKDGWKPQGGIAISQCYAKFVTVSQAMIKEEESPNNKL